MEDNTINYNLVEIALEKLSGFSFESFANAFFAAILELASDHLAEYTMAAQTLFIVEKSGKM